MSNVEELRERIKNKEYEGFLNPGYETILSSLETMEVLKETLNQSYKILLDKAPDDTSDAFSSLTDIDNTIKELENLLFIPIPQTAGLEE